MYFIFSCPAWGMLACVYSRINCPANTPSAWRALGSPSLNSIQNSVFCQGATCQSPRTQDCPSPCPFPLQPSQQGNPSMECSGIPQSMPATALAKVTRQTHTVYMGDNHAGDYSIKFRRRSRSAYFLETNAESQAKWADRGECSKQRNKTNLRKKRKQVSNTPDRV